MAEIKPYDDQRHREQVLNLFADVEFKRDIWSYQFQENPGARDRGFAPVVAEENGSVVGFNGVVPVSILWNGRPTQAMWSCDFKVSERQRGKGVGRLIKAELAQRSPILMSFGISPVAAIVLQRMGWRASDQVHFLRKIRQPRSARDWALMLLQFCTRVVNRSVQSRHMRASLLPQLPPREQIDELWAAVAQGYDKVVVRDWAYLDWRYQRHPFAQYSFLEVRDENDSLKALGVVHADDRQVRMVDYIGPVASAALKSAVVAAMLREWPNAASYSAMTSDLELKQVMKAHGFYQGREQPRFFVWESPQRMSSSGDCTSGWFIMGGDSDGELLQSAREAWNEERINKDDNGCRLKTL